MSALLLAVQFLTAIPLKISKVDDKKMAQALIYFPIAGLIIGLLLAVVSSLLFITRMNGIISGAVLTVTLVVITGGIHLDGLADTFDALSGGRNKDEMLKVMRDPHIGVMGVLSIICILLLKTAFLSSLDIPSRNNSLILMCVLSRWSLVAAMFLFPYARKEGKAKVFMEGINLRIALLATALGLAVAFFIWKFSGILLFISTAAVALLICRFISRKLEGITGDSLGALNELAEVFILLFILILRGGIHG